MAGEIGRVIISSQRWVTHKEKSALRKIRRYAVRKGSNSRDGLKCCVWLSERWVSIGWAPRVDLTPLKDFLGSLEVFRASLSLGKFIPFLVLVKIFLDEPSLVFFLVCFQCLFIEIQHWCVNSFLYFSVLRENKNSFTTIYVLDRNLSFLI